MANTSWRSKAQADLGVTLGNWQALGGGDFAQSYSASVVSVSNKARAGTSTQVLPQGSRLFIKTHGSPPPNHFSTEALGLQRLGDTGTVRVPAVLGVSDDIPYLAIGWVEESRQHQSWDEGEREFGRQLAALHQVDCPSFGREDKRSTGSLGLPNQPSQSFAEFYATQRLLPLAQIAAERHSLSSSIIAAIEKLAGRLEAFIPASPRPSILHGDLWAGNRLVDVNGRSWMIDPASHGGHREFDLAMMRLFGGYADACFDAYHEVYALESGWQQRVALHQLAPLIVHAIKFGDAYVRPTQEALLQYG